MLYLIDAEIDYGSMGDRRDELIAAEHTRTKELRNEGVAVVEWRKASGRGVMAVWDCADHDTLNDLLRSLPLSPYLSRVEVIPLVPHPLWPRGRLMTEEQA
jgi:muconolactone delta-isomerase